LYSYLAGGEGKIKKKDKIMVAETGTVRLRESLPIVQGSSSSAGVTKTISTAAVAKTTNTHLIDARTRAPSTDQMQSLPQPLYRSLSLRKFCSHGIERFPYAVLCISPRDKLIVSVGNAMFSCFWSAGIMAGVPAPLPR
jgi:hypothetical protein